MVSKLINELKLVARLKDLFLETDPWDMYMYIGLSGIHLIVHKTLDCPQKMDYPQNIGLSTKYWINQEYQIVHKCWILV